MEKKIISGKLMLMVICLLLSLAPATASYGVGYPVPDSIQITQGGSARFYFIIDTNMHSSDIMCSYPLKGETPLIVEFDNENTEVKQKTSTRVYGTVTAPEDTPLGEYKESFCVDCDDILTEERTGAVTKGRNCGIPIKVEVVREITKVNEFVPEKPAPSGPKPELLGIGILLVILAIIAYQVYKRHRNQNTKPKKEASQRNQPKERKVRAAKKQQTAKKRLPKRKPKKAGKKKSKKGKK